MPRLESNPPVGEVNFGDLRRLTPISRHFGYERGSPVDRYYIENFLEACSTDIKGRVLEIGDNAYTTRFGGSRVITKNVLHVHDNNASAAFVGDLTEAPHIPSDSFDCFILTQTLHLIFDLRAAINTIYRILKPGGVLLATAPGISHLSVDEWADYWCWSFTPSTLRRLFAETFPENHVSVEQFGNVLASIAFLQGLSTGELTREELDCNDRCYPLLVTVRAVKPHA
ncbi:MAG: methyltransferase domain-containing protein [Gammaproteobacteria bacterium]|nr:methyltransferase domain-containing protein [Gammaproteobacteria bacterium]